MEMINTDEILLYNNFYLVWKKIYPYLAIYGQI